jgi:hypothetical protein
MTGNLDRVAPQAMGNRSEEDPVLAELVAGESFPLEALRQAWVLQRRMSMSVGASH